jgi:hypothetical protein
VDNNQYAYFKMDITLNRNGYDPNEIYDLFEEPFSTLYPTRIGFEWQPAIAGFESITIELIFCLSLAAVTTTFVKNIATDLYKWTKNTLAKALNRKERLEESRVFLTFENDITVIVYVNTKDELLTTLENIKEIITYVIEKKETSENIELDSEQIRNLSRPEE